MKAKNYLFLVCSFVIFLASLSAICLASQPTIVYLHETISVGTSTPSTGTTTLNNPLYDITRSFEAVYTYRGANTLFYRYDGGTVTVNNGHPLSSLLKITSDKIQVARNMQFICDVSIGTVTATYMRVMP